MARTLSEQIVDAYGTGEDPAEIVVLDTLNDLTATAAELNYNDIATLGTGAASKAVVLDASGDYTYPASATITMPSGGTETFASGSTLTVAGTLTMSGSLIQTPVAVPDATPYTVLLANSGHPHKILEQTSNITLNLPAVTTSGQRFRFEMGGVAAEAQNWIFTAAAGAFLTGGVTFVDNDAGAAADEMHAGVYGNGSSHLTLTVVTPAAGTWVEFISNGTIWYVNGFVNSATVPAFS